MLDITLLALAIAAIVLSVLWDWWKKRSRTPATPAAAKSKKGFFNLKSNESLAIGAIVSLLVGIILAFGLSPLAGYPMTHGNKFWLGLAFGILYFAWTTGFWNGFMVPPTYRGVVLLFGNKRMPAGPNGEGLEEGPNWLPLGYPFFVVSPEEAQEIKIEIKGCEIRTLDRVPFLVDGFIMVRKTRPDVFRGVAKPYESIGELAQQALRDEAKLMDSEAFSLANKEELSDTVEIELRRLQAKYNDGDDRRWGLHVVDVELTAIKAPEDLQAAWKQMPIQKKLGEAENYKAERRKDQAKAFKEMGVDPNTALAAAMVNAQEPGAKMSNVAFEGLDEVGKGIGRAGEGLGVGFGKIGEAIKAFADVFTGKD